MDLGMHLLDEVMLDPGKLFDAPALFPKLIQQDILLDGQPAHPPKTNAPANRPGQRHPEREADLIHAQTIVNCTRFSMIPALMA
jgi:hypothetical protein